MSTLEPVSTTASAPAASAARRTVPALPGSRTWHSTAISRGRASRTSLKGHVHKVADGDDSLRGHGVRHRGEDVVGGQPGVDAFGQFLKLRVAVQACLAGVHLTDHAGLPRGHSLAVQGQGFPDGLGAFGQELAAL